MDELDINGNQEHVKIYISFPMYNTLPDATKFSFNRHDQQIQPRNNRRICILYIRRLELLTPFLMPTCLV